MTVVIAATRTSRSWSARSPLRSSAMGSASSSRTGCGNHASSVLPVALSIVVRPVAAALAMPGKLAERRQVGLELGAQLAAQDRHRPAGQIDVQVLLDVDDEL